MKILLRAATSALHTGVLMITGDPRSARSEAQQDGTALPRAAAEDAAVLIYELLDAHYDTARLAEELEEDPDWQTHLDYLRALQRNGREMLSRMPVNGQMRASTARTRDRR
jgi:hypothetical protein